MRASEKASPPFERYRTKGQISTFEDSCWLSPEQMAGVYLVRRLASLFDCYVNDAFSAAHHGCPSMVAFQQLLLSALESSYDKFDTGGNTR